MKSRSHSRNSSHIELRLLPIAVGCGLLLFFASAIPRLRAGPTLPAPSTTMFPLNGTNSQAVTDLGMGGHSITNINSVSATNGDFSNLQVTNNASLPANTTIGGVAQPTYPVVVIPIGAPYTDFIIKATRVNFGNNGAQPPLTTLFYDSADPSGSELSPHWINGTAPLVYFTDSAYANLSWGDGGRVWLQQDGSHSIAEMRALVGSTNGVIAGAVVIQQNTNSDMYVGNGNLVWSYARMTSSALETDTNGNTIWHPIVPMWAPKALNPNATNY